jgi:hypothetical protein
VTRQPQLCTLTVRRLWGQYTQIGEVVKYALIVDSCRDRGRVSGSRGLRQFYSDGGGRNEGYGGREEGWGGGGGGGVDERARAPFSNPFQRCASDGDEVDVNAVAFLSLSRSLSLSHSCSLSLFQTHPPTHTHIYPLWLPLLQLSPLPLSLARSLARMHAATEVNERLTVSQSLLDSNPRGCDG